MWKNNIQSKWSEKEIDIFWEINFSPENEKKIRDLIKTWIEAPLNEFVKNTLEDISNRITWLVDIKENFEYKNLLNLKKEIFNKKNIELFLEFYNILTDKQKEKLNNYKKERIESVIYWGPLSETQEEKLNLEIWEELYFIEKNIENILDTFLK
jgi:hypothetical protein